MKNHFVITLVLLFSFLIRGNTLLAQIEPARVGLLLFPQGSSKLTSKSKEKLEGLYLAMLAYPDELVTIQTTMGYVEKDEGELYNKRMLAVIEYMMQRYSVKRDRFYFKGYEPGDKDLVLFRLAKPIYVEEARQCVPLMPINKRK